MPEFGTLERVDVREAWKDETGKFTPWLSTNLERLTEVIGIPLELIGREVRVEQFSADILARNSIDGSAVLVENQLEATDHTHLGQILTYLAGLDAQTVIWVARDFQEAHLSAIRWLNEHTVDPFSFFAVRLGVVRIGDSPMTPIFEVIERPSGWDRRIRAISQETGLSELGQFRREFWEYYTQQYPDEGPRPGYAASYVRQKVIGSDIGVTQFLAQGEVGMYLLGSDWEQISSYEDALRSELGVELGEYSDYYRAVSRLPIDCNERANWSQMANWLHENLHAYRDVLTNGVASRPT